LRSAVLALSAYATKMGRSLPLATVIASIPVGSSPSGVAVTPDGGKVYVTNTGTGESPGTVSVISTATDTVIATIGVGFGPTGIAVTPDGSKVYVANFGVGFQVGINATVSVISTATDTVIATITIDRGTAGTAGSEGVAVTPDGSKVYVASDDEAGSISVINTATNMVAAKFSDGGVAPFGVAVTGDGGQVYVANLLSHTVSVIKAASDTVTATIPVGNFPIAFGMFIQPRPTFAGTPRSANCYGQSVATLATQFGGLIRAASALAFSSIRAMQDAIMAYCGG